MDRKTVAFPWLQLEEGRGLSLSTMLGATVLPVVTRGVIDASAMRTPQPLPPRCDERPVLGSPDECKSDMHAGKIAIPHYV